MNITHFWQQVYAQSGLTEEEVPPVLLSQTLDQGQRWLMRIVRENYLHNLVGVYRIASITDLHSAVTSHELDTQPASLFQVKGTNGIFWTEGVYDDADSYSWPEGQTLKPELFRVVDVSFSPHYLSEHNELTQAAGLFHATEITWEEMRRLDDVAVGDPAQSDRYYEGMVQTPNILGSYVSSMGTFDVERSVRLKWAAFGNYLMCHPRVDTEHSTPMEIWALFFPERFLDMNNSLKQTFVNDDSQCQLPPELWPALVEWTARSIRQRMGKDAAPAEMSAVIQDLQLGDMIHERSEQERHAAE